MISEVLGPGLGFFAFSDLHLQTLVGLYELAGPLRNAPFQFIVGFEQFFVDGDNLHFRLPTADLRVHTRQRDWKVHGLRDVVVGTKF